jgi:hypothetical protein
MPETWDAKRYRALSVKWREEAETLPPGKSRDACMALAEGYAKLAAIIEEEGLGGDHTPEAGQMTAPAGHANFSSARLSACSSAWPSGHNPEDILVGNEA